MARSSDSKLSPVDQPRFPADFCDTNALNDATIDPADDSSTSKNPRTIDRLNHHAGGHYRTCPASTGIDRGAFASGHAADCARALRVVKFEQHRPSPTQSLCPDRP